MSKSREAIKLLLYAIVYRALDQVQNRKKQIPLVDVPKEREAASFSESQPWTSKFENQDHYELNATTNYQNNVQNLITS
jgi:hypothetical protein